MNILYLTDELNYADGVSTHLFYLLSGLLKKNDLKLSLMCSGGDAVEKFKTAGINVVVNKNLNHSTRTIKGFLSALRSVSEFCKLNNINIIHSHNHYAANISAVSLKIRLSKEIKTFQTVHGIIPETGKLNHLNAGTYITVNDHVYQYLRDKIRDNKRIRLIYNGVDFKKGKNKEFNNHLKFVSAGRLDPGKKTNIYIQAVGKLSDSEKDKAEFIIAGEGSKYEELKKLNEDLETGIQFTGLIKDIRKYFKTCDVFVMTSGSEGLPMTLLEAASEKVMVVSSDFEGIENILRKDSDGLVFPVDNAEELSEKLRFIINNPDSIKRFTDNFFTTASAKFNSEIMTGKHYDLYRSILTNSN